MVLGDSLTHGYGLAADDTFPAQLEAALQAAGLPIDVINAGVSGDTSAGGLARLDWALADAPDAVMIELGANDALRGIDPAATRDNLEQIIEALQARDLPVLLTGMMAPRNYDAIYIEQFDGLYADLAARFRDPAIPVLPGWRGPRPRLEPSRRHPSQRPGRRRDRAIDLAVCCGIVRGLRPYRVRLNATRHRQVERTIRMTAYVIARVDVHDPDAYAAYAAQTPDVIAAHGGRFVVRGGNPEGLEGTDAPGRVVVIAFPDRATAQKFYGSPDYQAIVGIRHGAATSDLILVDGTD